MGSDADLRKLEAKIRKKAEEKGEKPSQKQEETKEKPKQKKEEPAETIIRIAETNLNGDRNVIQAIRKVRGISFMMANAICKISGFGGMKLNELTEEQRAKLEDMVLQPAKYGIPAWMYNRRRDPQTGNDIHLAVSHLDLTKKTDIDNMRKMKCYKGVRHSLGLPVRGQRTRGSFRTGGTVGVSRKKAEPAKAAPAK